MTEGEFSWSRPAGIPGLFARKQVDKSMFIEGSHIPEEFHVDFRRANMGDMPSVGESRPLTLVHDGKEFRAVLRRAPRPDRGGSRVLIYYSSSSPFASLLRVTLAHSYHTLVDNPDTSPSKYQTTPDGDREYVEFYETGVPYRYVVKLVPRTACDDALNNKPLPQRFADVWTDLGRVLGNESVITTLAAGKRNVVSWREREGISVATDRGTDLLPKSWFEETWDRLLRNGVLTEDNLPGEIRESPYRRPKG